MAYLFTAIMTGGVSAILTLYSGGTIGEIFLNYLLYGHLGIAALALASVTYALFDRRSTPDV